MMRANRTHVFIYIAGSRIAPIIIYSANNCLTGTVDCAIPIRSAYNYTNRDRNNKWTGGDRKIAV
jgi:hypothetical protein